MPPSLRAARRRLPAWPPCVLCPPGGEKKRRGQYQIIVLSILKNATKAYLDKRHCTVGVVDGLYHSLRGHEVSDSGGGGQVVVVVGGGGGGDLLIFKGVQEVLATVLLVAVFDNGA